MWLSTDPFDYLPLISFLVVGQIIMKAKCDHPPKCNTAILLIARHVIEMYAFNGNSLFMKINHSKSNRGHTISTEHSQCRRCSQKLPVLLNVVSDGSESNSLCFFPDFQAVNLEFNPKRGNFSKICNYVMTKVKCYNISVIILCRDSVGKLPPLKSVRILWSDSVGWLALSNFVWIFRVWV